jgi:hypothetical protein
MCRPFINVYKSESSPWFIDQPSFINQPFFRRRNGVICGIPRCVRKSKLNKVLQLCCFVSFILDRCGPRTSVPVGKVMRLLELLTTSANGVCEVARLILKGARFSTFSCEELLR